MGVDNYYDIIRDNSNNGCGGMDPQFAREMRLAYESCFLNDALTQQAIAEQQERAQSGGRLPAFLQYEPCYQQKGGGWGSILSSVFKFLLPAAKQVAKKGGKALAKHALSTTSNILGDVISGENWKESGKRRLGETGEAIVGQMQNKVQKMMSGNGGHVGRGRGFKFPGNMGSGSSFSTGRANKKAFAENALFSIRGPPLLTGRALVAGVGDKKYKKAQKKCNRKAVKRLGVTNKKKQKNKKKKKKKKKKSSVQKKKRNQRKKVKKQKTKKQTGGGFDNWI